MSLVFSPILVRFCFSFCSMRIFCTCWLHWFCHSRLQGERHICSRQRFVIRKTSSKWFIAQTKCKTGKYTPKNVYYDNFETKSNKLLIELQHHWREGNLPQTSKCAYCRKSCWSTECLTGKYLKNGSPCKMKRISNGISNCIRLNISAPWYWVKCDFRCIQLGYRCEWCGMTTHGGCRAYISNECTFGVLQPIYLPPHAVSIPRTEVPMEAIIGVQVKSKSTPLQRDYSCRKYSERWWWWEDDDEKDLVGKFVTSTTTDG